MDPDDDHFDHYDLERIEMVQDMIEHWWSAITSDDPASSVAVNSTSN
jgi:hypothetical protein